jgi:hypothetical protein
MIQEFELLQLTKEDKLKLKAESSNLSKTGQGSPRWHDNDIRFLKSMNSDHYHPMKGETTLHLHFPC